MGAWRETHDDRPAVALRLRPVSRRRRPAAGRLHLPFLRGVALGIVVAVGFAAAAAARPRRRQPHQPADVPERCVVVVGPPGEVVERVGALEALQRLPKPLNERSLLRLGRRERRGGLRSSLPWERSLASADNE